MKTAGGDHMVGRGSTRSVRRQEVECGQELSLWFLWEGRGEAA